MIDVKLESEVKAQRRREIAGAFLAALVAFPSVWALLVLVLSFG